MLELHRTESNERRRVVPALGSSSKTKPMGFFSWHTQDTDKSIANGFSIRPTFPVYMIDDKGNKYYEKSYGGYGVFGGKDFYELLAEMNGLKTRGEGITLFFSKQDFLSPNLAEDPNWEWRNESPESCPDQGFFYGDM